jgi:hypothetical protein
MKKPKTPNRVRSSETVSLRQIQLALRRIQNQRKKDTDRALYGAEQALGWAAGLDYMNPAKVWND